MIPNVYFKIQTTQGKTRVAEKIIITTCCDVLNCSCFFHNISWQPTALCWFKWTNVNHSLTKISLKSPGEGPEECKTVYESLCETRYHEHDVEDDVVDCETIQEEKCEDVTQGYTTEKKCTKWPKQVCTNQKKQVKKYSPETECKKVPRQLCGPSGCVLSPGPEECFDKKETVVQEVSLMSAVVSCWCQLLIQFKIQLF